MASQKEILQAEIERRSNMLETLSSATAQMAEAKKQQKDLDDNFSSQQQGIRADLQAIYRESRHYTGKEPRVYTEAEVTTYPFYQGEADDAGNPYFRVSVVKSGKETGIAPMKAPPTFVNGRWTRDRSFAPTEDVPRQAASNALKAYPDYTGEPLPASWPSSQEREPSYCSKPQYTTQSTCTANQGNWLQGNLIADPVWVASETAPEVLRAKLDAWKQDLQQLIGDTYSKDSQQTKDFYNSIIAKINDVLTKLPAPSVFVRATGNTNEEAWGRTHRPLAGEQLYIAIQALIASADNQVATFVTDRKGILATEANDQEDAFFTFINMRLHNVNGSFAKFRAADMTDKNNASIIKDHRDVIEKLNKMMTKL